MTLSATVCALRLRAAEPAPTLVIRVFDLAHTRSGVLIEAQHHVTRVYGVAGITVLWREGEADAPEGAVQVTVLILSDAMTQNKTRKESRISSGVLGTAAAPPATPRLGLSPPHRRRRWPARAISRSHPRSRDRTRSRPHGRKGRTFSRRGDGGDAPAEAGYPASVHG